MRTASRRLTCADKFGRERKVESGERKAESKPRTAVNGPYYPALLADETGMALFETRSEAAASRRMVWSSLLSALRSQTAYGCRADGRYQRPHADDRPALPDRRQTSARGYSKPSATHSLSGVRVECRPLHANADAQIRPNRLGDPRCAFARRRAMRTRWSSTRTTSRPRATTATRELVVKAYELGWRKFKCYGYVGQRFLGCGLGPDSDDVVIDAYGSSGDYLASGLDGATVIVHGNAQDQVAQILKSGKLVVHGDVGQTFMYGAKGGDGLRQGQRRGPASDQRRRQAQGHHQRHMPRLPGGVVHGGRSADGRRVCDPQRRQVRRGRQRRRRSTRPTPARTCSRWHPAARSMSATRTSSSTTSSSTAASMSSLAKPTGS